MTGLLLLRTSTTRSSLEAVCRNESALREFGTTNADGFQVAFVDNRESMLFPRQDAILPLLRHGGERCGHRGRCQVFGQLQGTLQLPGKHRELVRSRSQ